VGRRLLEIAAGLRTEEKERFVLDDRVRQSRAVLVTIVVAFLKCRPGY